MNQISLLDGNLIAAVSNPSKMETILDQLLDWSVKTGGNLLAAALIFFIGRFIISFINKFVARIMARRNVEASIQGFTKSLVNIALQVLLVIAVIGKLGIETTSFAALLASAGVAIGMAFSGNLSNFAGGIILLVLRPYKVGDYIECQGKEGVVQDIQIFHTVLRMYDNQTIFVPNGALSSGTIVNKTHETTRRIDVKVGVEYGEDFDKVKEVLLEIVSKDERILKTPEPFITINNLDSSSVEVLLRIWVKIEDYGNVLYDMNVRIYQVFNQKGIDFPYPQLTIHQA